MLPAPSAASGLMKATAGSAPLGKATSYYAQRRNARLGVRLEDEDLEIHDFIRMADNKDRQQTTRSWQNRAKATNTTKTKDTRANDFMMVSSFGGECAGERKHQRVRLKVTRPGRGKYMYDSRIQYGSLLVQ